VKFLDTTLHASRTMRRRGKGGLGPSVLLLLPCIEVRLRRRRGWWRRPKSPSRNAERSGVRPIHGAARNRNPCEGSSRVPRYRFLVPEPCPEQAFFFQSHLYICSFDFYLFLVRCCKFCCTSPYYHGHCIACARSVIPQPSVCGRNSPSGIVFGNTSDGWFFVSALDYNSPSCQRTSLRRQFSF
jgi:hypothetical protein